MKPCKRCEETKPLEEFYRHARTRDGRWGVCKVCSRTSMQNWRASADPEMLKEMKRNDHLKRTYGITLEDYDAMLLSQGGGCACCGKSEPNGRGSFYVDHDHATKAIRGLLCHHCNIGIGCLGDDIAGVRRALEYLERVAAAACL